MATRHVGTLAEFTPSDVLRSFRAHKGAQIELMVRSGLVRFIDPLKQDWWRYTLQGAVKVSLNGFWKQFRAMVWPQRS